MADNFHLLKEFIYSLYVRLHEVLAGAQGIFAALCGIFWVAVQTLVVALGLRSCGMCRVKKLGKVKFGKMRIRALFRNRSPLMRREGAAVRLVSCCANPRKEEVYIGIHVESYCLKGAWSSPRLFRSSCLLNGWGKEFWRSARGWDRLGAGRN